MDLGKVLLNLWESTGLFASTWQNYVMLLVSFVLFYLAIWRKFEPLLLVPIAFGMFLANIPGAHDVLYQAPQTSITEVSPGVFETTYVTTGGLFWYLSKGVEWVIFPPLVFLGIGAMTDFGPLIANPKSLLLGAGAQLGIFVALALGFVFFDSAGLAASVAIIGGADGPTAIYVTTVLGQSDHLGAIAIAAYSYMALIPAIQPPLMKLLTTKKERQIRMRQLRTVSRTEKIIFPIVVIVLCGLLLPSALPLLGMLMLGNLLKVCLVTDRLAETASNGLCNVVTILLGTCVGFKAVGDTFLDLSTLGIIVLGLGAFAFGTIGGVLVAKLMNLFLKEKINPLIGSAGVSAVPMAARVSQSVGQKELPDNYLLMHAMGPNVAGVIGSSIAAGILISMFG